MNEYLNCNMRQSCSLARLTKPCPWWDSKITRRPRVPRSISSQIHCLLTVIRLAPCLSDRNICFSFWIRSWRTRQIFAHHRPTELIPICQFNYPNTLPVPVKLINSSMALISFYAFPTGHKMLRLREGIENSSLTRWNANRCYSILYEPHSLSLRSFKFFFQQLHWFLQLRSCFIKWYEKEGSIKLRPLRIHNCGCFELWIYFM